MDQSSKDTLVQAIELLKAGQASQAAVLLANVLKEEPELVQGWYMLGLALEDEEKKIRAFKRVLKLDPSHEKARKQLEKLEDQGLSTPVRTPEPEPEIEPAPPPAPAVQDDFNLPDWMQDSSFDPSDYASEIPGIIDSEDAEIPAWAQQSPLEFQEDTGLVEQPATPIEPEQVKDSFQPESGDEAEPQGELTGYYGEIEDDDAPPIDWGDSEFTQAPTQKKQVAAFFDEDEPLEDQEEDQVDQPEWLREMVEDDGGKKKRKKKEKVPKKLLSPEQRRRRRKIITYLLILVVCIGLGYGGYYYQDQIKPYIEPYWSPVMTQAAPVTDLLTQGAPLTYLLTPGFNITPTITSTPPQQPTSEPTWTPSSGQAQGSTSGSNQAAAGSATITPTPIPLDDDIIAEIAIIEEQVKTVRNLPGPLNLEREIMSSAKLRQIMQSQVLDEEALSQLEVEEISLRALGFINDDYDLTQAVLNARGDALGGYYDADLNKINLIGSGFGGVQKYIYAHEYAHALQDANFDLNSLGLYPSCTKPFQACLATRALVEGEATLVNQIWLEEYPPEVGLEEISNFQPPDALFQDNADPPYFEMNTVFAYETGLAFVEYLFENGGWNGVNRAYAVLPDTTEQVMHPAKYQQREQPLFLDHPDLSPVFRNDWEFIRRDSLGEWASYLLLAYNDYPDARRPDAEAKVAAEGWGADEYRVYYNPVSQDVFLSAYWIWDSQADANQFYNALLLSLSTRFGRNAVDGPGESGICWSFAEQTSCLYQNEDLVLWLYSDNQEILEAAREKFTKLP